MGKVYKGEGSTFDEAFANLGIRTARGISVWTITENGATRERIISKPITSRIFGMHGLAGEIARKNISMLLGV